MPVEKSVVEMQLAFLGSSSEDEEFAQQKANLHFMVGGVVRVVSILLVFVLAPVLAFSHPGRTDSQGGHYNRKTGVYHFHSGGGGKRQDKKAKSLRKSKKQTKQVDTDQAGQAK